MGRHTSNPAAFKLAIAALGGQGGGVLTQWLLRAAESSGFIAQSTSVPGVAQRTGATLYYLEFFPRAAALAAGAEPVLALMPNPGDVDLVAASELMEAGRAIQRGLVARDRTTLVVSTHRVYTISEKSALGDGLSDSETVLQVARASVRRLVALDMDALSRANNAVISAVMLGALAGSGALPFEAQACEDAIRASGRALASNLAAFEAGRSRAAAEAGANDAARRERDGAVLPEAKASADAPARSGNDGAVQPAAGTVLLDPPPAPANPRAKALMERIASEFPPRCGNLLGIGAHRLVDYHNHAYAGLYLDRLLPVLRQDSEARGYALLGETACGLALWMSYEDTARVAELKTRGSRFARVRAEAGAMPGQVVRIVDYLAPRAEEICGSLPAWLGAGLLRRKFARRLINAFTGGKRIATDRIRGYLLMRAMARTRIWRLSTLRHREEDARIRAWLDTLAKLAPGHYELAVEFAACQTLVKGYGETFERGLSCYQAVKDALPALQSRSNPAEAVRELRAAALADEQGEAFDAVLARLCENPQTGSTRNPSGAAPEATT